jgi:hypothetical protein
MHVRQHGPPALQALPVAAKLERRERSRGDGAGLVARLERPARAGRRRSLSIRRSARSIRVTARSPGVVGFRSPQCRLREARRGVADPVAVLGTGPVRAQRRSSMVRRVNISAALDEQSPAFWPRT